MLEESSPRLTALLLLLLTSSSVAQGCSPPSGYELRVSPYYKTFSTPASFDAAKSACQADGAHLVYFRTDVEESNLWHYASILAQDSWSGLENPNSNTCANRAACLGQVEFGDGTDLADFAGIYTKVNFASGQNCAIAKPNGLWEVDESHCANNYPYVCQFDCGGGTPPPPTTTTTPVPSTAAPTTAAPTTPAPTTAPPDPTQPVSSAWTSDVLMTSASTGSEDSLCRQECTSSSCGVGNNKLCVGEADEVPTTYPGIMKCQCADSTIIKLPGSFCGPGVVCTGEPDEEGNLPWVDGLNTNIPGYQGEFP